MTEKASTHEMLSLVSLEGKVALVVGGYGAIGTTVSKLLAKAGAITLIAGRDGRRARELATSLASERYRSAGIEFDACDVRNMRDGISKAAKQFGTIDILVNCIGFNKEQPLLEVTEQAFDEVIARTLRPAMFLSQAVAEEQILSKRGGSQIHLLSVRSALGLRNRGYSAFCAAKGGMAILLKQLATELAPHGVTVNGIAPGLVRTYKNDAALQDVESLRRAVAGIPLGRLATPTDVAGAAFFFMSPLSRFVTGQILYVDGGLTCSA